MSDAPTDERPWARRVGIPTAQLAAATWLPDELWALGRAVARDGRPFHGAFVPLVIHDPALAERAVDAAEWAADLIRAAGGHQLCIAPFVDRDDRGIELRPRQWNHAAAMLERFDELCDRYRIRVVVHDLFAGRPARDDRIPDPEAPIHYVLDAGSFLADGYVPTTLVSPTPQPSPEPTPRERNP